MKCPYCDSEMQKGMITGDGRSAVKWQADGDKPNVLDRIFGSGDLTAAKISALSGFKIDADYCAKCHKMIFDTDIQP
ncbi:MAG: hypothetical protein ILP19_07920 [Oscillospiraceae bacterium]|nr:hypothetical protein [Oscillospiraceae bacterium]